MVVMVAMVVVVMVIVVFIDIAVARFFQHCYTIINFTTLKLYWMAVACSTFIAAKYYCCQCQTYLVVLLFFVAVIGGSVA